MLSAITFQVYTSEPTPNPQKDTGRIRNIFLVGMPLPF